jgi:hypothetical protein
VPRPPLWDRVVAFVAVRYFTVDRRVLGLFRIGMGLVLLVDVLRRLPYAAMFYSDVGVLPSALAIERPVGDPTLSLFYLLHTPRAVEAGMLTLAIVDVAYLIGYRTRLAQILVFIGFASLTSRNAWVANRGHIEMSLALMWTLLLPLGDRYSLDALRAPGRQAPNARPVRSLAVMAITVQIAAIYGFNSLQKGGIAWEKGQAVHYVLWQNRVATDLAGWFRMHEPSWFSPAMSFATVWGEGLAALLVLSPLAQRSARTAFLLVTLCLHGGIALFMNLWPHSFIIMMLNLMMLPPMVLDRVLRIRAIAPMRAWVTRAARNGRARFGNRPAESPGRSVVDALQPYLIVARESAVMVMLVAVIFRIAQDNRAVPEPLRPKNLGMLAPLITYPRLYQQWSMFAEAPTTDGTVVVDGLTEGGAHIDPFTGKSPDFEAPLHGPWGQSLEECDYYLKIQQPGFEAFRGALTRYLERWQEINARPAGDRLVSFRVFWVSNDSPSPGATTPTHIDRRLLLQHP